MTKRKSGSLITVRRFFFFIAGAGLIFALALAWRLWPHQTERLSAASFSARRFSRPYGMAPAAFDGLMRACSNAKIHPYRIGQTIGDHPLSAGYHHRDGIFRFRGQNCDYCAAVDLGTSDLNRDQIGRFLESLAAQGFAAFYREKGKWRGHEHIHAIYSPLRMKWQLQSQMREWEAARKRAGKPRYRWQRRWRRNWR